MMHSETLEAIKRSAAVPSMPMVAARCHEMTNDPDCSYDKLVELLGTDPGIAADILRLSNSALFGVTRQVGSLKQAITLLGMKRVRDLVMARYLAQQIDQIRTDLIDVDYYWRRSLTTGILASKFADTLAPRQRDEVFIGGLLADVGVVVLARALPKQYASIAAQYRPHASDDWIQGEYSLMGVTHGDVSAMVLEQWNLPVELVEAVRYHHASAADIPEDCAGAALSRIIGGAGTIARILCEANEPDAAVKACADGMDRVELDISVLVTALSDVEQDIEQMAGLLGIEVINSKVFSLISQRLIESLGSACGS